MIRILFIDDDSNAHRILKAILPREYHLISSYRGDHGLAAAAREMPDVILLDIDLPDTDGMDVLKALRRSPLSPPVVMLSALATIGLAVNAMRLGAVDYLVKPLDAEKIKEAIRTHADAGIRAAERCELNPAFSQLVGQSLSMMQAKRLLYRYASSDRPVLITGESGTGKELAARILHNLSPRSSGPFVARNCAAIPETLFEAEMFGAEKGAFTDSVCRDGAFEQAQGGTLFLDELAELSPGNQARLLRVLESGVVRRLGATKEAAIDVRIVSATNRKLQATDKSRAGVASRAGGCNVFRNDLYYRVSTLPVLLPPLRERSDDIPLIVSTLYKNTWERMSPAAREKLLEYRWPGNVRELKNVVERAALLAASECIGESDVFF